MKEDIFLTGIFTLSGAFIGGLFTYLSSKIHYRSKKSRKDILRLCLQVKSYYMLEKLYCSQKSNLENRHYKTVLQEMRDQIDSNEFDRPTMTAKEADKLYKYWY